MDFAMTLRVATPCLAAMLLSGCVGTPTSGVERMSNAIIYGEVSVDDGQIVLTTNGPIDIDVDSFAGTFRIIADPSLDATYVEPVRRSSHGHMRLDDGKASLEALDYRVDLVPGDLNTETLEIHSWSNHPEMHFQGVDFRIRTPSLNSVRVVTERGRVWVKNNTGSVSIETTYGDIRVLTEHPMTESVTLVTKEASIDYRVPGGSTGLYHCVAKSGEVYHRITAGRITSSALTNGPSKFAAQVDNGENPVDIRTSHGDIRVAVVDNPTDVGSFIIEP